MLAAFFVFLALAIASLVMGARAYGRIEAAKGKDSEEFRRITAERRQQAMVFLSYRGADLDAALSCAQWLEAQGYEVVMYDPNQLWDNPLEKIIRSVMTANAVVYLAGMSSDWIKAEIELAGKLGLPFFVVDSRSGLEAQGKALQAAADGIDLVARLGCHHPHDREMLAIKLMGAHTDDLENDSQRGRYARSWLPLGEVVGDPQYFSDRLKYVGGAFGFYLFLVISISFLIAHLLC